MFLDKTVVVIPAYKPDFKLINTIHGIVEEGFSKILVIDDGSGPSYEDIFEQVKLISQCTLLRHPVNKGKGAALKTAFSYFRDNLSDFSAAVTADADGQHLPKDIKAVAEETYSSRKVILGVRDFSSPDVPARSKSGNRITSAVFKIFFGMSISDTQTGLRGFPAEHIADIMTADGDRYEYETNMLFLMNKKSIPYGEVKIETVYIEENKSSHFRVVRDSIRIYGLIIKYLLSAVAALIIDSFAFNVLNVTGWFAKIKIPGTAIVIPGTVIPQIIARIISSLVNYFINAKVVFKDTANKSTLIKYYILAALQLAVGAGAVAIICHVSPIDHWLFDGAVHLLVQAIIYPISFRIQHKWVFNSKAAKKQIIIQNKEGL